MLRHQARAAVLALVVALAVGCAMTPKQRFYVTTVGYAAVQSGIEAYLNTPYGEKAPAKVLDAIGMYDPIAVAAQEQAWSHLKDGTPEGADAARASLDVFEDAVGRLKAAINSRDAYEEGSP